MGIFSRQSPSLRRQLSHTRLSVTTARPTSSLECVIDAPCPNYDLCANCLETQPHGHTAEHLFLRINAPSVQVDKNSSPCCSRSNAQNSPFGLCPRWVSVPLSSSRLIQLLPTELASFTPASTATTAVCPTSSASGIASDPINPTPPHCSALLTPTPTAGTSAWYARTLTSASHARGSGSTM
jgi:hypothetical protein